MSEIITCPPGLSSRIRGYRKGLDYFERTKLAMMELASADKNGKVRTLVGFSLIIDDRNIQGVLEAAREIRRVTEEAGGGVDYVIVRPVMNYQHFDHDWARMQARHKGACV